VYSSLSTDLNGILIPGDPVFKRLMYWAWLFRGPLFVSCKHCINWYKFIDIQIIVGHINGVA
jgi:hypothetical protein